MREFVDWLDTPFERAVILTLLKTGVRIGELINIDLSCVHIGDGDGGTHPFWQSTLDRYDVTMQSELRNKPDSMYIYTHLNEDTEKLNEIRKSGNKRKDDHGSVIPLDDELKTVLVEYLLTRNPPHEHEKQDTAIPLFCKPSNLGNFERLTYSSVQSRLGY